MALVRIPEKVWRKIYCHLFTTMGEHFAFMCAKTTTSRGKPIFNVHNAILLPDEHITVSGKGWELDVEEIVNVINGALHSGDSLIEVHNHGGIQPRFSTTDRQGLAEFPSYVLASLPNRPYGATVWGDRKVYGEYFLPDGSSGIIDRITVIGSRLQQIVSRDDDNITPGLQFDRQLPWFTPEGQQMLSRIHVAIVGAGGTGSPIIQGLVFVGLRHFLLIDPDESDPTSMNRLITANAIDVGIGKIYLGERLIKAIAPEATVIGIKEQIQSPAALDAIKGADIIFGCVDNDGARLIINELAKAYGIPYIDLAVGIKMKDGKADVVGGRIATILPEGPCLICMREIDVDEARYFLSSREDQETTRALGYVSGLDIVAPSVGPLNSFIANCAINEFLIYCTGDRPISPYLEYDLLGKGRAGSAQWLTPRVLKPMEGCIHCANAGEGDKVGWERYLEGKGNYHAIYC